MDSFWFEDSGGITHTRKKCGMTRDPVNPWESAPQRAQLAAKYYIQRVHARFEYTLGACRCLPASLY